MPPAPRPASRTHASGPVALVAALALLCLAVPWTARGAFNVPYPVNHVDNGAGSAPRQFVASGGTTFFTANDGNTGVELWKTGGTTITTTLVKDIQPGPGSSVFFNPYLVDLAGKLYFAADDGIAGQELWVSDGTAAGTVLLKDIQPGPGGSSPSGLRVLNGTIFFAANDGTSGLELWKTDGTAAGTLLVKDINPSGPSNPGSLTVANGKLFFSAVDPAYGGELWVSDGTAAGTLLVSDIVPGAGGGMREVSFSPDLDE